jgi:hypothetical protein
MKVSTEIDNNFGYEKITQLVDNIPLIKDDWKKTSIVHNTHIKLYTSIVDLKKKVSFTISSRYQDISVLGTGNFGTE